MKELKAKTPLKARLKHFISLVLMQLRDKMDRTAFSTKRKAIFRVVFLALRFIAVAAISYLLFYYAALFGIFSISSVVPIGIVAVIFTIIFVLSVLSCTSGLMNTLYFADDNKVLVTLPVTGDMVFFSKLVVYFIFELGRSYTFTLPILLGYGMSAGFGFGMYVWLIFALFFVSAAPVALGALLSMPAMAAYKGLKRHETAKIALLCLVVGACVWGIISLILAIPENINIVEQRPWIMQSIYSFVSAFNKYTYPSYKIATMLMGSYVNMRFVHTGETFVTFGFLLAAIVVFLVIVYLLAKPLFLKMTAQPFEYEKKENIRARANSKHTKYRSILLKELRLALRSTEISYSFIVVYLAVPIMILLLNKIFAAMSTKLLGQYMTYSFNLLIILLILLASNAIVSTMYSMEGRAGGMKKTKPINLVIPLLCKIFYNGIMSIVSIGAAMAIFGAHTHFTIAQTLMLAICVLAFQYGHILWCAERDLMNPQNEQYATSGTVMNNPNSNKATLTAFLIAFAVFGASLKLFTENPVSACIKLMLAGIVFFIMRAYLFVVKVRVYYREKM
ncbi:MAG: hypothetical protein IKC48_05580 [Clostridia bacterium]|nr:hypothetical protein [Clostridia bacterium]